MCGGVHVFHGVYRSIVFCAALLCGTSASAAVFDYLAVFDVSITEQFSTNPGKYQAINQIAIEWQVDTANVDPGREQNWGTRPYNSWRMTIADHVAIDTNQDEGTLGISHGNNFYGLNGYFATSYPTVGFSGVSSWYPTAQALNDAAAQFTFGFDGYEVYGALSDPNEFAVLDIQYLGHEVFGGPTSVPLPAALPLLLAGLAGLGLASRRKVTRGPAPQA